MSEWSKEYVYRNASLRNRLYNLAPENLSRCNSVIVPASIVNHEQVAGQPSGAWRAPASGPPHAAPARED